MARALARNRRLGVRAAPACPTPHSAGGSSPGVRSTIGHQPESALARRPGKRPQQIFMNKTATATEPLLRTLSPALHELETRLRAWLNGPRRSPLSILQKATLEGLAGDLARQSEALALERPL